MDYSEFSDAELNRLVAERIEPEPWKGGFIPECWECLDNSATNPDYLGAWRVTRHFCTDPAAWGWLLERERMDLLQADGSTQCWVARPVGTGLLYADEVIGRAIAIAYLSSTEGDCDG